MTAEILFLSASAARVGDRLLDEHFAPAGEILQIRGGAHLQITTTAGVFQHVEAGEQIVVVRHDSKDVPA